MKTDSVDRRSLLVAAGGIAAAGALGSVGTLASEGPSPEFRGYLRCVKAHIDISEFEPQETPFESAEYKAWEAQQGAACEARYQTRFVIQNRPVRSERDFRELVRVVQEELWQRRSDGSWEQHSLNDELEEALAMALFQRIEGGAHA